MRASNSRHFVACLACLFALAGCGGDQLDLAGTVERRALELGAPISEVIVEIPVEVGQAVEAGALVVKLDSEVAEAELRASEAALDAAKAGLVEAQGEYKRISELQRRRVSTPQELDRARRGLDEARAGVAEREARLAQSRKRLEDLTVRSRAPGVVDQLPFEIGERVPAGGVVAVVLAADEPWVRVWMPARSVIRARPGAPARVHVLGLDEPLTGRLTYVSREAEFTPHYALTERESAHLVYEARIALEDAPEDLRPGVPARVELELGEAAETEG